MDQQLLELPRPAGDDGLARPSGIGDNFRQRDLCDPKLLDELLLERLNVVVRKEVNLLSSEQRQTRPQGDEFRHCAFNTEHVRNTHPVQGPVRRALRRVEISVKVYVNQTDTRRTHERAGYSAELDRAIAAEDKHG